MRKNESMKRLKNCINICSKKVQNAPLSLPTLKQSKIFLRENDLTREELYKPMISMALEKSPGNNGLTKEL